MRKNTLNFAVDALTLLTMLVMILTGLLIEFVLPPRRATGVHQTLWGMDRHDWGEIHFWTAVVLGLLLLLHVALHWEWVCVTVGRLLQRGQEKTLVARAPVRNVYGAGFLALIVAIIGGFLWVASANVRIDPHEQARGSGRDRMSAVGERRGAVRPAEHETDDAQIRGSMTLAQVEEMTGVAVAALRAELNLSDDVSANERLGYLRRKHGFEMSDVREAVRRLQEPQP